MQSSVVREHVRIPDEQNIMVCLAMESTDDDVTEREVCA